MPDIASYLDPIEKAVRMEFIPPLLGVRADDIDHNHFRQLLALSVRTGDGWEFVTKWQQLMLMSSFISHTNKLVVILLNFLWAGLNLILCFMALPSAGPLWATATAACRNTQL